MCDINYTRGPFTELLQQEDGVAKSSRHQGVTNTPKPYELALDDKKKPVGVRTSPDGSKSTTQIGTEDMTELQRASEPIQE